MSRYTLHVSYVHHEDTHHINTLYLHDALPIWGREIAVRQAMGAQRTRLIRQLLTESLLLFLLGGIAGFAILFCTQHFLLQLVPESLPHLNNISISWGVLAFALAVSVAAGSLFGLAPAWLMSRLNLTSTLRQEGRGSSGSRER